MSKILNSYEIRALQEKGYFTVDNGIKTMDGGLSGLTPSNSAIPAGLLTTITPEIVKVITRKRTADDLVGAKRKVIDWATEDLIIPVLEHLGEAESYSDYGRPAAVSLNPSYVRAGHKRFSTEFIVGDLESEQLAKTKISAESEKAAACLETLAIKQNNIAIFGTPQPEGSAYAVYGLLNNPDLPPYTQTTTTTATATFDTFYADIQAMITKVLSSGKGYVDTDSQMVMAISPNRANLLGMVNQFGRSIREVVKENYPNLKWVLSPELQGAYTGNLDTIYLRVDVENLAGVSETAIQGFSEFGRTSPQYQDGNARIQIVSAGSTGAIVYRPYLYARMYFAS